MPFPPSFPSAPASHSTGGRALDGPRRILRGSAAESQPGGRGTLSLHISYFFYFDPFPLFFFCARRLFCQGASLVGIATDPLRAGGGITRRGRAGRCERALLSIALDAGRCALPMIVFAAERGCAGQRGCGKSHLGGTIRCYLLI